MLTHAPFLERARVEHQRDRDLPARLALAAYLVSRLVDRTLDQADDSGLEDGLQWQLDAVRRHLRELPADAPESAHLHGMVDAIQSTPRPRASLRLSLMAYAYYLEHEGRLEEALEVLALAVRTHGSCVPPADFAASALFAGRLNRLLARWTAATSCYAAAESAAATSSDSVLVLRAKLGGGAVHRGQGNLPLAQKVAEEVAEAAREAGLREVEAMAYADLGAVMSAEGRRVETIQAIYRAFQLTDDVLQRTRILGDLGVGLREIGAYDAARTAFDIVLKSKTSFLVRANALLELMDMESSCGNRMAFERRRTEADRLRQRMPPSMVADFYAKAGVGLARFGQVARGRELLRAGQQASELHELNAWYFRFEQMLGTVAGGEIREPEHTTPATDSSPQAVREVAVGLREFALQAT